MRPARTTTIACLRGFSLVELTFVMMVIGIMTALALPRYSNALARYRADATARRIVADLNLARAQARSTSTTQPVVFDLINNNYQLPGVTTLDRRSTNYQVNLAGAPYYSTLSSVDFATTTQVTFSIFGEADNSGTIVITAGEATKTITFDATNSSATIQ